MKRLCLALDCCPPARCMHSVGGRAYLSAVATGLGGGLRGHSPPSQSHRSSTSLSAHATGNNHAAAGGGLGASTSFDGAASSSSGGQQPEAAAYPFNGRYPFPIGPRVCILGGGFGGLYTAIRLQSLLWPQGTKPQVTLVDKSSRFVFKPLLYELVNGGATEDEVAPTFAKLLAPYTVNFIQGTVEAVEPKTAPDVNGEGRVVLAGGGEVEYDWLVLALGADSAVAAVPGAREHALPFYNFNDALQTEQEVRRLEATGAIAEVIVVGGGYAGVELATSLADRFSGRARVKILSGGSDILGGCPSGQRAAAHRVLAEKGISTVNDLLVESVSVAGESKPGQLPGSSARRTLQLKSPSPDQGAAQQSLEADLVLWTAGSSPVTKAVGGKEKFPFPYTDKGAMQIDATLRVKDQARVFALGDVSGPGVNDSAQSALPATAQVAFQQADYVAWNLWAAINNRPLLPFKYQHLGDMMSLGRSKGAVTLPVALPQEVQRLVQGGPLGSILDAAGIRLGQPDGGVGVTLEGPLGGALRRAAYWYRQPTSGQRLDVGVDWLQRLGQSSSEAIRGLGRTRDAT